MIEYVVRPGDSLYTIASRYGVPVQLLAQINGLSNTDIVYVGQALQIPVGGGGAFPTPQPIPPFVRGSTLQYCKLNVSRIA